MKLFRATLLGLFLAWSPSVVGQNVPADSDRIAKVFFELGSNVARLDSAWSDASKSPADPAHAIHVTLQSLGAPPALLKSAELIQAQAAGPAKKRKKDMLDAFANQIIGFNGYTSRFGDRETYFEEAYTGFLCTKNYVSAELARRSVDLGDLRSIGDAARLQLPAKVKEDLQVLGQFGEKAALTDADINEVKSLLHSIIGTMQLPHHGAEEDWDANLIAQAKTLALK